jgi:hypothetical protein
MARSVLLSLVLFAASAHSQLAYWCPEYPIDSVYHVGDTVTMCWDSTGITGTRRMFRIGLSLDGGATYPYCIEDIYQPRVGGKVYYQWEVSGHVLLCGGGSSYRPALSETAVIRVWDVDPQYTDDTLLTPIFAIRPALHASPISPRGARSAQAVRTQSMMYDISGRAARARIGTGVAVRVSADGTARRVLFPAR